MAFAFRRLYQTTTRFYCNFNRSHELVKHTTHSTDLLLSNLKSAHNTKNILDMVSQHSDIMNNKHVMQALRSLFVLQKNGNSNLSTNEILAHNDFKRLCRKLRVQAGGIELGDVIEALKVVSYVGVSSGSTIFQVLLQMIRHNVNNLNLQQIIFLDFLLQQSSSSPLADALKIALPIVFEIHLPQKIDTENIVHLAECLYFASNNSLAENSMEKIVTALLKHDFDAKTAKSIIWSICNMDFNEIFRPLMKKAINSLMVHLDDLTFNEMETTLSKLILRYSRKTSYFYDETFFTSCANYVIDKDMGYKQAIFILRKFGRVNFFNRFLLDYLSKKLYENPSSTLDALDIYAIAVNVAMTDYRPVHWDYLKNLLAKSENLIETERKEIIWIKFAASLCLLDIYKIDVLGKCLNETNLRHLFNKKKYMSDFENYTMIWQSIKLFKPELNCLLSKNFDPEIVGKLYRAVTEFPLEPALCKILGGDSYVKTNLLSKSGVHIDHAVVFRKGGYPVAMNFTNVEFLEDIEVPPDNQLVVILALDHYNYTINNKILKASTNMAIKVLELQGYQVVPIDLEVWGGLPDFEKIPYIMRTIKEKTENSDLKVTESVV